jgi:protoporphyrinogen oxidase
MVGGQLQNPHSLPKHLVIIGGGPAGLSAAYESVQHGLRPAVLEKAAMVGGLARTETYKAFHFDLGGHRFFTKSEEVKKIWQDVLGDDFLRRPRLSRIYFKKRFFRYPLKPFNTLKGLGVFESILILLSYLRWQLFPYRRTDTFEQWVTNLFGKRLFLTFFKTYTEKVWGIPCSELKAEWAAQRIKGLSLKSVLLHMFVKPKTTIKSLIEEFDYPRLGPGMMWNAIKTCVEKQGGIVRLNADVTHINRTNNRIDSVVISCNGYTETVLGTDFISSMPVTEFIQKLEPPPPPGVLRAAEKLHYRDFLTVCLIVNQPHLFPDNWIYIHDPQVKVGRIQNFKNWSPGMVPDSAKTSLGLEYFCTQGDGLWNMADVELIDLGKREVERLGLANYADIDDGCVVRVPKSYPVYDAAYRDHLATIREFITGMENVQTIGRNGLHRYNNQDHAMLSGMLAVRNLALGQQNDLWDINTDQEYHEEIHGKADVVVDEVTEVFRDTLAQAFPKLDRRAFGLLLGVTVGALLFLATLILVLKGGDVVGPNLGLLNQFFPGYSVTTLGSVVGLAYGFIVAFIGGWLFAFLRNAVVFFYMAAAHRRAERKLLRQFLGYL